MAKFNSMLYNIDDLASFLKVSRATVYRMVDQKKISFFYVGKGIRFKQDDVDSYLDKNSIKSLSK